MPRAKIINIGNSKGITLSNKLINQYKLESEVLFPQLFSTTNLGVISLFLL
jgi:hypothetical protein